MRRKLFTIFGMLLCVGLVVPAGAELVGHWQFEGDLADATGNGNDGSVLIGTVGYAGGVDGSAIQFNGEDSVSLPVTVGSDWSVGCWYLPTSNGMFLTAGYSYSGAVGGWESLFIRPWGTIPGSAVTGAMDWWNWWDNGLDGHFGEWDVETGVWHHVVVTYSGDGDNTWTFYIDGIKMSEGNIDFTGWYNNRMTIGGAYAQAGLQYSYSGLVDDVRLYDNTLTELEIFGIVYPRQAFPTAPADGIVTYDTEVTLEWEPPAEAVEPVTYDVYLGSDPNESSPNYYGNNKIASGISSTSVLSGALEAGNLYTWRVDVIDPNDGSPYAIRGFERTFRVIEVTSRGLVGQWAFDGDLSDSIEGRTGSALGDAYAGTDNGVDGGAAVFDGTDDAIVLSTEGLGARWEWTVTCWVKNDVGNSGMFMSNGPGAGYETLFIRYYYSNITGVLNYSDWNGVNGENGHVGEWFIDEGEWYHIAFSYEALTGRVQFYLNGILKSTSYAVYPGFYGDAIVIGAAQAAEGGSLTFDYSGLVDDVRLYDYALTELEVSRIINPGAILPNPVDGETNAARNAVLSWTPGEGAESFRVYMTSDPNDALITARDPSLLVSEQVETSYDPDPELEWDTHYFWAVDEIHEGGSMIALGEVWEFTVAASVTCDPLLGDLDGDCFVTLTDLAILSENWLACSYNNEDCP